MNTSEARRFGPYDVSDFLRDRKGSRNGLILHSVLFRQGVKVVGLDIVDKRRLLEGGPILFMGTLKLTKANKWCLSEEGEKRLVNDLARRIDQPTEIAQSRLRILCDGSAVNINICGQLFGEPGGLETSGVLTMISRDKLTKREHEFIVQSLHVQSYALSRVYLSKWRALREINTLANQNEGTPVHARTPRWLVTKYLEQNLIAYEKNNEDHPTHTPRHVHRSEVYNLLARHCQWLTEKLSKQRPAVINLISWKLFATKINARMEMIRVPNRAHQLDCDGLDELFSEEYELMPDEEQPADVPPETDHEDADELGFENTHRLVAGSVNNQELTLNPQEEYIRDMLLTKPEVLAEVKVKLIQEEPTFPTTSRWQCPECNHQFNLRDSTFFGWMDETNKCLLSSKEWGPTNGDAVDLFQDIVEHHFYEHLEMSGIKHMACRPTGKDIRGLQQYDFVQLSGPGQMKEEDIGYKFEWIKPGNHKHAFHHLHNNGF